MLILKKRANDFTIEQRRDIDAFVNFILPFIKYTNRNKIEGPEIIKDLEVSGAGVLE